METANSCAGCGSGGTTPHTTDCLFGHFLDYQNWRELSWATKQLLRVAYEHGMREGAKARDCGKREAVYQEQSQGTSGMWQDVSREFYEARLAGKFGGGAIRVLFGAKEQS